MHFTRSCCSGPEGYGSTPPCTKRYSQLLFTALPMWMHPFFTLNLCFKFYIVLNNPCFAQWPFDTEKDVLNSLYSNKQKEFWYCKALIVIWNFGVFFVRFKNISKNFILKFCSCKNKGPSLVASISNSSVVTGKITMFVQ